VSVRSGEFQNGFRPEESEKGFCSAYFRYIGGNKLNCFVWLNNLEWKVTFKYKNKMNLFMKG